MYYVGIDWATKKHDIYITDDSGKKLTAFEISDNQGGLTLLVKQVQKFTTNQGEVLFAMETDKGLLVEFLLDCGYTVYSINPKAVDRFRDRYRVSGAKTDPIDAMVLANILRTDRHNFRPILPDSELAREVKILARDRKELVHEKVRITNQITSALKNYFPVALEMFDDLASHDAIDFLKEYPTYEEARKLSRKKIEDFFKKHRVHLPNEKANKIYGLLHQPQIKVPEFIIRAKRKLVFALLAQLDPLLLEIKKYEEEIENLSRKHPDSKIYLSLPGMGKTLSARILGELGDNRDKYKSCNGAQCHAGTAPITKFSGKSKRTVRIRRSCNKELRDALQLFAFCSVRRSKWAKEFYYEHRAKGNTHSQALRALANRWLEIIYAILKKKQFYDENYHASLRDRYLSNNKNS